MQAKKLRISFARTLAFGAGEWGFFFALWLLYENQINFYELLFGAGAALLAAVGIEVIRGRRFAAFRPRPQWIAEVWRLPWYVVQGNLVIFWAMLKQFFVPEKSVLRSVPFDAGGSGPSAAARRALAIAYTTMPPNFVVLSIDLVKNVMLVHQVQASPVPRMTQNLGAKS